MSGYRRAAVATVLRHRAALLAQIREFFATRGVIEVETPILSSAAVSDLHIESIAANVHGLGRRWLHTSPEYAMKRLLADGLGDIYQICRVFRDGELGRWHQPEFTMLEWYRVGWDEHHLMDEVEALLVPILSCDGRFAPQAERLTCRDAFGRAIGADPFAEDGTLAHALRQRGVEIPDDLPEDAVIDLAFAAAVVPSLDPHRLTLIHDFPPSQAALALIRPGRPATAARFEAFAAGLELANGYAELTDADEQQRRFDTDLQRRRNTGRTQVPIDQDYLAALRRGLPPAAGVAVGVDRLLAAATGVSDISAVVAFAHELLPAH